MKNGLLAARRALFVCLLLSWCGAASAASITNVVFADDFESGNLGQWTPTSTTPSPLQISPPGTNVVPAGGQFSAQIQSSANRMHHNLGGELGGPSVATWWIYDPGNAAPATRIFCEVRGYAGGSGLPNGGTVANGTLSQLLAAGKFNQTTLPGEVFNPNRYQGRSILGVNGWFNLDGPGSPNRSIGWHRFDIVRQPDNTTIEYYVDGILSRVIGGTGPETWDTVIMGLGAGSTIGIAWIDGVQIAQLNPAPPLTLSCPPDITTPATGPGGATVNYPLPTPNGGCPPIVSGSCNPPSGSNFPIGTTPVNCTVTDSCGQTANCSFNITVQGALIPIGTEIFFRTNRVPPTNGMYVPPMPVPMVFPNGVVVRDAVHRNFGTNVPIPRPGVTVSHAFSSTVDMKLSLDGGLSFSPVSAPAQVQVQVTGVESNATMQTAQTEMLQLDIVGGSLPAGVRLRESPTQASSGQATIRKVPGGSMISSFFDVFTELSMDGGVNWIPPQQGNPHHVVLRKDPRIAPPIPAPTDILPPRNDKYVSPADFHAAYAAGIIIKDASHSFFTQGATPPPPGGSQIHEFGSQVDLELSLDGGNSFQHVRAPAAAAVGVANIGSSGNDTAFDTEMLSLDIAGGTLPPGLMIRESPTEPSRGGTEEQLQADGTYRIGSFFDIFTEVSLDGGQNWIPADAPIHVQLQQNAPEQPYPTPNLPPPGGSYISPADWHALYANGIIITNASHDRFLTNNPPPPPGPGVVAVHSFNSTVTMQISMDGGLTFQTVSAPAPVTAQVSSTSDDNGSTRYFDTEMQLLSISGGGLPAGVMVRESPTRASAGRTSIREVAPNDHRIASFFGIFTEISLDGGANWSPQVSPAVAMALQAPAPLPVSIACPANMTVPSAGGGGTVVNYPAPIANGGCTPPNVVCNPPSGSPFPDGTTVVTCTASDTCGSSANCSFTVTVQAAATPPPEIFFPNPLLPPPQGAYISPATYHQLYANGIIISNISHNRFLNSQPPPPPGPPQGHVFGSTVDMEISLDGGVTFQKVSASADVGVQVTHVGGGPTQHYDTEMMQLSIAGGTLPPGVMVRESPTLASTGHTTIRPAPGGVMMSSFFDVFTELSVDGGLNWSPAQAPAHVELRKNIALVPPVTVPGDELPPRNGAYVSPSDFHILTAQGVVISNVSHSFFTQSQPPPPVGGSSTHNFDSQVDMQLSLDGGNTFQFVRAPAGVSVRMDGTTGNTFDTEMLSLNIQGGGLPLGVMIRESPSFPSRGGVSMTRTNVPVGDPDFDLLRIGSFFDIFVEVSIDGGQNWSPAQAPAHVQLQMPAPEQPTPNPNLPPLNGEYISPDRYHALFAQGVVISNVSHNRFLTNQPPPPPPGGQQTHSFGSSVSMMVSVDGGATFSPVTAPAAVTTHLSSAGVSGNTHHIDTEMLALNIQGGGLPAGMMLRESPTRASTGRTSIRSTPGDPVNPHRIGSFFDIFVELSVDGGANWSPADNGPVAMRLNMPSNNPTPVTITCPPDMTVPASGPGGATVNYPAPTVGGGCTPPNVSCNPPSGSAFPVGTTTVTCTASDTCGGTANCSFNVQVTPATPVGTEVFFPTIGLPPTNGVYISPQQFHQLYQNGIIIRHPSHRFFTQSLPPPPAGGQQVHNFGSQVSFEHSSDGGMTWQKAVGDAQVTVQITHTTDQGGRSHYDTEMLQLDISGAGLPAGVMLRESPSRPSLGHTTLRPMGSGYMMSSFFDIFTELSLDGGANWSPAQDAAHVELRRDPAAVTPVPATSDLLPPRNDAYVSPAQYHILTAQGIVLSNVSHSYFTQSQPPPPAGVTQTHNFDSQVDMMLSTDGGATFSFVRAPAAVTVEMTGRGDGIYDTEMLSLQLSGGDLPAGLLIRESPTLPSRGGVAITSSNLPPGDPDFDLLRIGSFFDIFVEVSTDGGLNWSPANDPAHVELVCPAPEQPTPTPNLPPVNGEYISPDRWHQLYANGIIISNASHDRFTQNQPPPPPGGQQVHNFGSRVRFDFHQPGQVPLPMTATASVATRVTSSQDSGNTRYFDTEMLALNISGGGLPNGLMVRESPTRASLGRTSIRTIPGDGSSRIGSFFDIFTELSMDGGLTWSPAVGGPVGMQLNMPTNPPLGILCSGDITTPATSPAGAVVNYPAPSVSGGCPPINVVCNPPSGSTFPVGTTPVTCTASDSCGQNVNCSFNVTVTPQVIVFPPPVFFPTPHLPPTNGVYISPAQFHQLYANGVIIRDVRHNRFTGGTLPPPPGGSVTHSFGSMVSMELSLDGGATFTPHSAPAAVSTHVAFASQNGNVRTFNTEMLSLNVQGGTLPPGVMVRESPTRQSTGRTRMAPEGSGHMISGFFDVFTEVSLDGGQNWSPANDPARVELRKDPTTVPPIDAPTELVPPLNGQYVSPQQWHALYANGIVLSNVSHRRFTQGILPPASGSQTHGFGSAVHLQLSTDGGQTFTSHAVDCDAQVEVTRTGQGMFDTEMLSLQLSGGTLPPGLMIRESPTRRSLGGLATSVQPGGTHRIGSFFDIFTEISLDGGANWSPNTNGPAQLELQPIAPEKPFPTNTLPPLDGQYVSPQRWHALFAQGVIISNVSHQRFITNRPPPPPGGSVTHTFGSQVQMMLSLDNGATWNPTTVSADVTTHVSSSQDEGSTRYFDTEMLAMQMSGAGLPPGVMFRESPTRASTGKTSIRQAAPDDTRIASFFDVFIELSVDGGATWSASLNEPGAMVLDNLTNTPVSIVCPPDMTVPASGPGGAVVNYPPPTVGGGCTPPNVVCNPPSGSTFPIGTTTVTCTASDSCGSSANCTFNVTVQQLPPPPPPEIFFRTNRLPPLDGMYISPALFHQLYTNGIIIRDIKHARFTQNLPPPPPGPGQNHNFGSMVEMQVSTDGGLTYTKHSAPAAVTTRVTRQGATQTFDTEMLSLNITGGSLPGGVMVRESPTRASTGQTTVRPVTGGAMIGSFFDVFTELSLDGGANWVPAEQSTRVELRRDPAMAAPPQEVPNNRLPPRQGAYVSPKEWHQAYANGVVISNISHARFTQNLPPPPPGGSQHHEFDSHIDLMFSLNGGQTYQHARVNAVSTVGLQSQSSSPDEGTFDTEMLQLQLTGGGMPPGVMIRESPTLRSGGGVQIQALPGGTFQVNSFFDIFTELSVDGGANWLPANNGPAHVELKQTPEKPFPNPNLPPPNGQYVSPADWHALFANGIIITNVSHQRFLGPPNPPPPPGGTNTHSFDSTVVMQLSTDGGATFHPVSAPATVMTRVISGPEEGDLRFFDTEMLQLSLSGGGLPPGVLIRESPTRQSTGGTSLRQGGGGGYQISSFFDIFLESSTDGGATWFPASSGPSHVSLDTLASTPCAGPSSLTVTPTADGTQVIISWTGAGFRLQSTSDLKSDPAQTQWADEGGASGDPRPIEPAKNKFYRVVCP